MPKYVKVPIFPTTKFMTAKEREHIPVPMKPVSFNFGDGCAGGTVSASLLNI